MSGSIISPTGDATAGGHEDLVRLEITSINKELGDASAVADHRECFLLPKKNKRPMYFIPLTPIGSTCFEWAATDESLTEYRLQGDSLLHQPVEQQAARAGCAAVETKGEFVEVIVQM